MVLPQPESPTTLASARAELEIDTIPPREITARGRRSTRDVSTESNTRSVTARPCRGS